MRVSLDIRGMRAVLAACVLAAAGAFCPAAMATHADEKDLKTAYVYNFLVLASWPAEVPPVLRFCVAGVPADLAAFHVLAGKNVRERSISLVSVSTPAAAADCSALYVTAAETRRLEAWLVAVATRPVLTISDGAESDAAIVNLRLAGGQLVFDLNTQAASAARIQLSSQLMKLAARRR